MNSSSTIVVQAERYILQIRGQRVILSYDLAQLYGVPTKALNQAVKRNAERFPESFAFQLTEVEKNEVVTNCDRLQTLKFSSVPPWAFTEHGALMAATVLNSPAAIRLSVEIIRAFVRLREMLLSNTDLARKLNELEKKYDHQFKIVFDAIRQLMEPPAAKPKPKPPIGFRPT